MFLKKARRFLGLDIGKFSNKIVEFEFNGEDITLTNLGFVRQSENAIENEIIISTNLISDKIKQLIKYYKIKAIDTAFSISGNCGIIKKIEVGGSNFEEIKRNIFADAPNYIPYDINEVSLAYHIFESEEESTSSNDVLIIAVKKEIIDDYLTILIDAGLRPNIADIDFFALQNIYEYNYDEEINEEEVVGIFNIGLSLSHIVILRGRNGIFYRDILSHSSIYYEKIQEKLGLPFSEIEKLKLTSTDNVDIKKLRTDIIKTTLNEISKALALFTNTYAIDKIDKFYLAGGGALGKELKPVLEKMYPNVEINFLDPFKKIKIADNIDKEYLKYIRPMFGIAAGLALRGMDPVW